VLIRQIQQQPTRQHNKDVSVRARVTQAWRLPYPHYWVTDGRDAGDYIHVACAAGSELPTVDTTLLIRGRLHAGPGYVAPNGHRQEGVVLIITEKTRTRA
jgi:hypothetical protein